MAPLIWYIGGIGITFLIVLFNSLIADYILTKNKKVLVLTIILLITIIFCSNYSTQEYITDDSVKIALIQGNIEETWLWRIENTNRIIETYENLSIRASKEDPDFIIWPEYAVPKDIFQNKTLFNQISEIARKTNSYLIFGAPTYTEEDKNSLIRPKRDSLLVFSPEGDLIARYDSKNPMPFDDTAVRAEKEYSNNLLEVNGMSIRAGLCFEELLPRMFEGESDFLVSIINHQFLDETSGLELTSQISKLMAAENKRYLVRSSNTGITQIVNPYGKVIAKIPPHKKGILIENIYI